MLWFSFSFATSVTSPRSATWNQRHKWSACFWALNDGSYFVSRVHTSQRPPGGVPVVPGAVGQGISFSSRQAQPIQFVWEGWRYRYMCQGGWLDAAVGFHVCAFHFFLETHNYFHVEWFCTWWFTCTVTVIRSPIGDVSTRSRWWAVAFQIRAHVPC